MGVGPAAGMMRPGWFRRSRRWGASVGAVLCGLALAGCAGESAPGGSVASPGAVVPDGEQPAAGNGWRLLGHAEGAGEPYRTGVATTDAQLATLWVTSGLDDGPPQVDWQAEIVVWLGAVYGSSCPVRLDDVVVEGDTLHGEIVIPGSGPDTACTGDANPHSYVIAVERAVLPEGPFVVQLTADDPPLGAPEERTVVDVDLSAPGATATDEELHLDPAGWAEPPLLEDGHPAMPENGDRYVWSARDGCDGVVIGPLGGTLWRLADGEAEWAEEDGQEVAFHPISDDEMVVTSPEMDYLFVRASQDVCGS